MEIGKSQGFYGYIYLDPDFDELVEVASRGFDTLRMGIHVENGKEYLVFGDGHGTTHSTVSRALGELNPNLRPSRIDGMKYQGINGGCIILYEENGYWVNAQDWSMGEHEKPMEVAKAMKEPAKTSFKDLIKLLEEKQAI